MEPLSLIFKRKSRLTLRKQERLLEYFVAGTSARAASELVGVQANTAINFFMAMRRLVSSKIPSHSLAMDVQYFDDDARDDSAGRIVVFGLLQKEGKIHLAIIPNENAANLQPVYPDKVVPEYVFYIESTHTSRLLFLSDLHYKCIHQANLSDNRKVHLTGVEKFWHQARKHMQKYNGVRLDNFYWFLKEYEWRFNGGNHKELLEELRTWYRMQVD